MRALTRSLRSLSLCLPAAAFAQGAPAFANVTLITGRPHERIGDTPRLVAVTQAGRQRTQLTFASQRSVHFRTTGSALSTK